MNYTQATYLAVQPPSIDIERLYNEHNERLKNFIKKKLHSQQDVEDILQLTYLEAIRCKNRFNGHSKPETWLFGIALNLTRNYHKRQYGSPHIDELTEELLLQLEHEVENDPAMLVEHRNMLNKTAEALDSLPEDIQAMFEMVVGADQSYQDTANTLDIPIGTIRSRMSRARCTIRKILSI